MFFAVRLIDYISSWNSRSSYPPDRIDLHCKVLPGAAQNLRKNVPNKKKMETIDVDAARKMKNICVFHGSSSLFFTVAMRTSWDLGFTHPHAISVAYADRTSSISYPGNAEMTLNYAR